MFPWHLNCSITALAALQKVLSISKLIELRMLDFSDHANEDLLSILELIYLPFLTGVVVQECGRVEFEAFF